MDAVQFSVLEAVEHVLRAVAAGAEVGSLPAAEVLIPIGLVRGFPPAGNGVALEVEVYVTLLCFFDQLNVLARPRRVVVSWGRLISRTDSFPLAGTATLGQSRLT